MAYLAMARKWRPKNFEEMVGQDHIAQTIRNAIAGKRISHAYLFTGTRGVGKTTSARILAKALNCKAGPTATPCEACENCKAVNAGNSMDVLEIDAASNTGVDNIRDLREQVKYAPMHGTYKIYVVDEVHMLSKSAFNALLKTLEEPPPHVVFIFATTEVNKVPQTILSRVQRFDFKRISEARIRERLEFICSQENIRPEREALEAMARKADGSMRDALSLFDQVYAFSGADLTLEAARRVLGLPREETFDALLRALVAHDQKACFDLLQDAHREGIETGDLLVSFGEYLRNLLFARQGVAPATLGLSDARHAELATLAPELRDGDVLRFAKIVSDLLHGLKSASNPRLSVELGFARMAALDRVVSLSQLLAGDLPSLPAAPAAAPRVAPAPPAPGDDGKKKSPEPLSRPAPEPAPRPAPPEPPVRAPSAPSLASAPVSPAPAAVAAPAAASASAAPFAAVASAAAAGAAYPAATAQAGARAASEALEDAPAETRTAVAVVEPAPPETASEARPREAYEAPEAAVSKAPEPPDFDPPAPPSPSPEAAYTLSSADEVPAAPPLPVPSADAEAEDEGDELEFPRDPEDPDMAELPPGDAALAASPFRRAAAAAEEGPVPPQEGPEKLPRLWSPLVNELMATRPILASQIKRSRLEWDAEDGVLRVVFLERSAHALIGEDPDFRKSIAAFLSSKLAGGREFQLRYLLDEAAAASAAAGEAPAHAASAGDDAHADEPIVAFIRHLFEGRPV